MIDNQYWMAFWSHYGPERFNLKKQEVSKDMPKDKWKTFTTKCTILFNKNLNSLVECLLDIKRWRPRWWLRHRYTAICSPNFSLGEQAALIWVFMILWHPYLSLWVAPVNGNTETVTPGTEALIGSGASPCRKVPGNLNCPPHQDFFAGALFTFGNLCLFCTL